MYSDTITLFNRKQSREGDYWYPTVLRNVDLNIDRAAIVEKYGAQSTDNATLHVKYKTIGTDKIIAGKRYLTPKVWDAEENPSLSLTFTPGQNFDFFIVGVWEDVTPISDLDFVDGLYAYMNERFDYVFAVTSVAPYSVIPHFEILAK